MRYFIILLCSFMFFGQTQAVLTTDQEAKYQVFMKCFPDYGSSQKNVTRRNINNAMPTLHMCDQKFSPAANAALAEMDFISVIHFQNCSNVQIPAHKSLMMVNVETCSKVFIAPTMMELLDELSFSLLKLPHDFPEENVMAGDEVQWLGRKAFEGNTKVKYAVPLKAKKEGDDGKEGDEEDESEDLDWGTSESGSRPNSARGDGDKVFEE